ncbi:hypothetical protein WJX72_006933 [[Myrmecia] bisecta]|uniref:U2 snRNP-associated SURP motif-containing protein n=1 Tax=[Myrmecia] bisecta TaxID=41462 RepID=A0AAW1QRC2_9CHLO
MAFSLKGKKTPFQKFKEKEDERKKRADEEAAKLYDEFVESFGNAGREEGPKAFVRGGTIQPGSSAAAAAASAAKKPGGKYVPSFMPPSMAAALGVPPDPRSDSRDRDHDRDRDRDRDRGYDRDRDRDRERSHDRDRRDDSVFALPSSRSDRNRPRQIDLMLENLKRDQEHREERQRLRRERGMSAIDTMDDDGLGSFDDGDPFTTNLYVGNLAPDVDEEVLKKEFGRFGAIASVKIMWPRDDDQRRRGRNCGFVAFMTREAAQKAKDELNGIDLHCSELKIGWGKAVVLPPIALYQAIQGIPALAQASKGAAVAPPGSSSAWAESLHGTRENVHQGVGPDIMVNIPADERVRFIIDSVAMYVLQDGCEFEQLIMAHEQANPEYTFLFDLRCGEHAYYRWRLYSLAQGDSLRSWRVEPFVLVEGGPRWIPPRMTAGGGAHQTAAQRGGEAKDKDRPLSDLQRDKFEDLLRALTVERKDICDAMVFALDNADSSSEVVEILAESLTLPETPVPTKVARLFLVSDILHNSTAPVRNASRYRSRLEAALPDIFESLQETYRSVDSRMTQEVLRRHVLRVLRVWRAWFIFSDDFLNGLQATFLRNPCVAIPEDPALGEELDRLSQEALDMRCRRNGLSSKGGRPAQVARIAALQSYLRGDVIPEPAQPAVAVERLAPPAADADQKAGAAEGLKAEPLAVGPDLPPAAAQKPNPPKAAAPPEPVSKWTLGGYDDADADEGAGPNGAQPAASGSDNIFSDAGGDTPVVDSGRPLNPKPAERDSSPEPDALARNDSLSRSAGGSAAAASQVEARGGAERMDAADEERRQRLRQVEVEVMVFREDLEDGGMAKADVEAKVAEHRAKLVAEVDSAAEAARKAAADKAERDKVKERARKPPRDKVKDKDKERSRTKAKDSDGDPKPDPRELHKSRSTGSEKPGRVPRQEQIAQPIP